VQDREESEGFDKTSLIERFDLRPYLMPRYDLWRIGPDMGS